MPRKSLWIAVLTALGVLAAQTALAQSYPTRPVRVITLTAPGGASTLLPFRADAARAGPRWGPTLARCAPVRDDYDTKQPPSSTSSHCHQR